MNDLDLIREFRTQAPAPDGHQLAVGRARLIQAATERIQPPPQRHPFRPTRPGLARVVAAAATVTVAAGTAAGLALTSGGSRTAPPPGAGHAAGPATGPSAQATLTARFLRQASATVERAPAPTEPAPGQWIYNRTVDYQHGQGTSRDQEWITFDGAGTAYYERPGGPLITHASTAGVPAFPKGTSPLKAFGITATPKTAYDALASLPSGPKALLAAIARAVPMSQAANLVGGNPAFGHAPRRETQLQYDYLTLLLWNAAAGVGGPPKAEAAVFRALATLPGITVQQGITDAAGAAAIGLSDDGGYHQLLLDPRTYQVLGLRSVSDGTGPVPFNKLPANLWQQFRELNTVEDHQRWIAAHKQLIDKLAAHAGPPKGTVLESLAYAQVAEVSGPGAR